MGASFEVVEPRHDHAERTCFLKQRTVFLSAAGEWKNVAALQVGDMIRGSADRAVEVMFKKEYPKRRCKLVTLRTSTAELTVTSDHRVAMQGGTRSEKFAGEVEPGDHVWCGSKPQRVDKVLKFMQRAELVELRFSPDEAVETFLMPHSGISTKGEYHFDPLPAVLVQSKNTFLHVEEDNDYAGNGSTLRSRSV